MSESNRNCSSPSKHESSWGRLHKQCVQSTLMLGVRCLWQWNIQSKMGLHTVNLHLLLPRHSSYKQWGPVISAPGCRDPRLLCMYEFQRCRSCPACLWTVFWTSTASAWITHSMHCSATEGSLERKTRRIRRVERIKGAQGDTCGKTLPIGQRITFPEWSISTCNWPKSSIMWCHFVPTRFNFYFNLQIDQPGLGLPSRDYYECTGAYQEVRWSWQITDYIPALLAYIFKAGVSSKSEVGKELEQSLPRLILILHWEPSLAESSNLRQKGNHYEHLNKADLQVRTVCDSLEEESGVSVPVGKKSGARRKGKAIAEDTDSRRLGGNRNKWAKNRRQYKCPEEEVLYYYAINVSVLVWPSWLQ